ncbi:hypothetical protein ACH4SP_33890 [Streptomyces sp. NPDC021093]|uniref:hypothetical protein n=1 Tax=Streptomyces sp. NPDC021093 TaxID=3365112 RepID=UPI0037B7F637
MLTDLEGGDAGRTQIAAQRVSRAALSGTNATFAEADGLYAQYNRVHQQLTSLSKTLGFQIELLSIGVHASEVGYNNVEEELRQRYQEIDAGLVAEQAAQKEQERAYQEAQRKQQMQAGQPELKAPVSSTKPGV